MGGEDKISEAEPQQYQQQQQQQQQQKNHHHRQPQLVEQQLQYQEVEKSHQLDLNVADHDHNHVQQNSGNLNNEDDLDLESAIANALDGIFGQAPESSHNQEPIQTSQENKDETVLQVTEKGLLPDSSTEMAIVSPKTAQASLQSKSDSKSSELVPYFENADTDRPHFTNTGQTQDEHEDFDDELENAIGSAFSGLFDNVKLQNPSPTESTSQTNTIQDPNMNFQEESAVPSLSNSETKSTTAAYIPENDKNLVSKLRNSVVETINDSYGNLKQASNGFSGERGADADNTNHNENNNNNNSHDNHIIINHTNNNNNDDDDEDDDDDLENVIGSALSLVFGIRELSKPSSTSLEKTRVDTNETSNILTQNISAPETETASKPLESTGNQNGANAYNVDDDELDLDAAIGDAFKLILPSRSIDTVPVDTKSSGQLIEPVNAQSTQSVQHAYSTTSDNHSMLHQNLAIGDKVNDEDLDQVIAQSIQEALKAKRSTDINTEDMELAISSAFEYALKNAQAPTSATDRAPTSANSSSRVEYLPTKLSTPSLYDQQFQQTNVSVGRNAEIQESGSPVQVRQGLSPSHVSTPAHASDPTQTSTSLTNQIVGSVKEGTDLELLQIGEIIKSSIGDMAKGGSNKPLLTSLNNLKVNEANSALIDTPKHQQVLKPSTFVPTELKQTFPLDSSQRVSNKKQINSTELQQQQQQNQKQQERHHQSQRPPLKEITRPTISDVTKKSLFSNADVKLQISSVMETLTSKINSGELTDSEILLAIRQVTEEIAAGGSLSQFFKSPMTIETFKKNCTPLEKSTINKSIQLACAFLSKSLEGEPVQDKAETLLYNFQRKLSDSPTSTFIAPQQELSEEKIEYLSAICNSVLNTLVGGFPSSVCTADIIAVIDTFRSNSPDARKRTRMGNRERKKRWREENAERNKDNELKMRVVKKANAKYGSEDSREKLAWIEEEFSKRKARRLVKPLNEENKVEASVDPEASATTIKKENEKTATTTTPTTMKDSFSSSSPSSSASAKFNFSNEKALSKTIGDVFSLLFKDAEGKKTSAHFIAISALIASISLVSVDSAEQNLDTINEVVTNIVKSLLDRTYNGFNLLTKSSNTENLLLANKKRSHITDISPSNKMVKINANEGQTLQRPVNTKTTTPTSILINSNFNSNHISNPRIPNVNSHMIKLSRPSFSDVQKSKPSLHVPTISPFISHKVSTTSGVSGAGAGAGAGVGVGVAATSTGATTTTTRINGHYTLNKPKAFKPLAFKRPQSERTKSPGLYTSSI